MLVTTNSSAVATARLLTGRRALIAETAMRTRETMRDAVAGLGALEIVCCERGLEALSAMRARRFDLVVCGQVYGDGCDSTLLIERIRDERLVALTGSLVAIAADRFSRTVSELAALGPDACVLRPFSAGQLRDRLSQIVLYKLRLQPVTAAIEAGDWQAALDMVRELDPKASDLISAAYRAVCDLLLERRLAELAEEVLGEARSHGEAPWITLSLARVRTLQGRHAEARELLVKLVEDQPDFVASYDALATLDAEQGEFDEALRLLQEATARTGFSLGRLRKAGQVAVRGGDLQLAERVLERVYERVKDSGMTRSGDYVSLVEVLAARGKLNRAGHVAARLRSTHDGNPDSELVAALLEYRRARQDASEDAAQRAFDRLRDVYERLGDSASLSMRVCVLEACVDQGEREDAYSLARGIVHSGAVDRLTLQRIRMLVDR